MTDKALTISTPVDLGVLTEKLKVRDPAVTGCSLNAGTDLTVHGGGGLSDADVLADVAASPARPRVDHRADARAKIDAALAAKSLPAVLDALAALKAVL